MRENVGGADRTARALIGPLLMGLGYSHWDDMSGKLMLTAGAALTATAMTRRCPLNALFGIDSAHYNATEQHPQTRLSGAAARPDMERTEGMPAAAEYAERRTMLTPSPD